MNSVQTLPLRNVIYGAQDAAQLMECACLSCAKPWIQSSVPDKLGIVAHTCNSITKWQKDQKFKTMLSYRESLRSNKVIRVVGLGGGRNKREG